MNEKERGVECKTINENNGDGSFSSFYSFYLLQFSGIWLGYGFYHGGTKITWNLSFPGEIRHH